MPTPENYQPAEFEDLSDLFAHHFIEIVISRLRNESGGPSANGDEQLLEERIREQINALEWVLGVQGRSAILTDLRECYDARKSLQKTLD